METQSLVTLTNGSLVTLNNATLNNATLIMFTYLTLLISYIYIYCILYHLLHLAYAARPLLIHVFICTYSHSPLLYLCVLGSCWELLDYLLDITALSEPEAQAFRYTCINIC
jgi:hypothetical protein